MFLDCPELSRISMLSICQFNNGRNFHFPFSQARSNCEQCQKHQYTHPRSPKRTFFVPTFSFSCFIHLFLLCIFTLTTIYFNQSLEIEKKKNLAHFSNDKITEYKRTPIMNFSSTHFSSNSFLSFFLLFFQTFLNTKYKI